jgi:SpoVK/Ycf46/Vps4 family AAA+-type ATPase
MLVPVQVRPGAQKDRLIFSNGLFSFYKLVYSHILQQVMLLMIPFDLIIRNPSTIPIEQLFFSKENQIVINQIIKEHQHLETLQSYGLHITHKILLHGQSGCGKTSTAKAIARALNKTIIITELSNLVSAKIGETSKQVKSLFDKANREKAVLFLDEFDLIGKARSTDDNDVGEMRRLVNTIIQLMDYLAPDAILIGATNFIDLIDPALLRRFELKMSFSRPTQKELDIYYDSELNRYPSHLNQIDRRYDISYAEAKDYIAHTMKQRIIDAIENNSL